MKTKKDFKVNPNPFYSNTLISFILNKKAEVHVIIYDLKGNEVKRLLDAVLPAGKCNLGWSGDDNNGQKLRNGIYMITLIVNGEYVATEKVVKNGY
jgi:flagellar hook assembly protein FlgD